MQIQGDEGAWVEIGTLADDGIVLDKPGTVEVGDMKTLALVPVSVEIVVDLEALMAAWRAAAEAYVRTFAPVAAAMVKTMHAAVQAARDADAYALAPPPPGRRRDRPAWQSPYGPPTRHRR
ncbi:hypothetical protein [Streptomyces sp. NPDC102283]|uniref:hypothetical protein n=1 Tax=Streptomyces sp. NPDC102283 TaxID=3366155 RepID=UPI00381C109A